MKPLMSQSYPTPWYARGHLDNHSWSTETSRHLKVWMGTTCDTFVSKGPLWHSVCDSFFWKCPLLHSLGTLYLTVLCQNLVIRCDIGLEWTSTYFGPSRVAVTLPLRTKSYRRGFNPIPAERWTRDVEKTRICTITNCNKVPWSHLGLFLLKILITTTATNVQYIQYLQYLDMCKQPPKTAISATLI